MIMLNCPSCGGHLELPESLDLEVVHCMFCGTKILLQEDDRPKEKQNIKRYLELKNVALQAKNYEEAIVYCNKILEIDPNSIESWLDKAQATFYLTTSANNRYSEAMSYVERASALQPGDERIHQFKAELTEKQGLWINSLAIDALERAKKMYTEFYRIRYEERFAEQNSAKYYQEAMDYCIEASKYLPFSRTILENIDYVRFCAEWVNWDSIVKEKIEILNTLKTKEYAKKRLPELRKERSDVEKQLLDLRRQKGFFMGYKISDTEKKLQKLNENITRFEKAMMFDPEGKYA